LIITGKLLALI